MFSTSENARSPFLLLACLSVSSCIGLVSAESVPHPALAAEGADTSFVLGPTFWSLLLLVLAFLLGDFHCLLGCLLTETGLDQEGLELILFLFSLDLNAMIALMVRFATVFTLDACLKFGDQRVVVQLSFASSASLAFSPGDGEKRRGQPEQEQVTDEEGYKEQESGRRRRRRRKRSDRTH